MQQQRLRGAEAQSKIKTLTAGLGLVLGVGAAHRPVVQAKLGVGLAGLCEPKTRARQSLVMPEFFAGNIGHRGMRKQQLLGGEG